MAFIAGVPFGGLAIGFIGLRIFLQQFVVDAHGVKGIGLSGHLLLWQKRGRRNEPSGHKGRRARQRAASGRDAEEDEAERERPLM